MLTGDRPFDARLAATAESLARESGIEVPAGIREQEPLHGRWRFGESLIAYLKGKVFSKEVDGYGHFANLAPARASFRRNR